MTGLLFLRRDCCCPKRVRHLSLLLVVRLHADVSVRFTLTLATVETRRVMRNPKDDLAIDPNLVWSVDIWKIDHVKTNSPPTDRLMPDASIKVVTRWLHVQQQLSHQA